MDRRLILLRHGDAIWPSGNQSDRDRELSSLGNEQAALIATSLVQEGWRPDRILSSPATRAHTTAVAIGSAHGLKVDIATHLYDGDMRDIQDQLKTIESAVTTLMLVGHNPTFSNLASSFSGLRVSLGTANAALLTIPESDWGQAALLDSCWKLEKHMVPV